MALKKYHFHREQHEAIYANSEEEARRKLAEKWLEESDFELTDVEDVPESHL